MPTVSLAMYAVQILDGATYRGIVGELVKKSVPSETIAVTDSSWLYSTHASSTLAPPPHGTCTVLL